MDRQQERVAGGVHEGPCPGAPECRGALCPTMMSPSPWCRADHLAGGAKGQSRLGEVRS